MTDTTRLDRALAAFLAALDTDAGTPFAAVLYGSAARGDWHERLSDINLLLVVEDPSPPALTRLATAVAALHRDGFTAPLIIGREEWRRATDVFPIEITDMQLSYRVLAGSDPVAGLVVQPADLRRALEEQLRGKLVRLRQAYVRFSDSMPTLGGFAASSSSELLVLMRSLAVLLGREPGRDVGATLVSLAAELGPEVEAVGEVLARRREPEWTCPAELFARYLVAITSLAAAVDAHPTPGAA
jgi:predicted nucleotidyltransferase